MPQNTEAQHTRATPGVLVRRSASLSVRADDTESRSVEIIASTEAVDSYNEVIEQKSWKLERFKSNPVILFGHDSRSLPIGRAENIRVEDGALRMRVNFAPAKANPLAEKVYQSVLAGTINTTSVGFRAGRIDREQRAGQEVDVLKDCTLFETSIVTIPANAEAMIQRALVDGVSNPEPPAAPVGDDLGDIARDIEAPERREDGDAPEPPHDELDALIARDLTPEGRRTLCGELGVPEDATDEQVKKAASALMAHAAQARTLEQRHAQLTAQLEDLQRSNASELLEIKALEQQTVELKEKTRALERQLAEGRLRDLVGTHLRAEQVPNLMELFDHDAALFAEMVAGIAPWSQHQRAAWRNEQQKRKTDDLSDIDKSLNGRN